MRILILSDNFPPFAPGGAEHSTFDLTKAFQKKGHEVFVITTCRNKTDVGREDFAGLKVYRIYANYASRWRAYLSLYNPQTVRKVDEILQEIRPNIVNAHNIHYYLSYACLKSAKKYAPGVFLTARDMLLFHYGKLPAKIYKERGSYQTHWWDHLKRAQKRYNPFRNLIIRRYLRHVDKIFAISNSLKEALNQNGISNVEVIYNGTDVKEWAVAPEIVEKFKDKYNLREKKALLFGGRLTDELKGGIEIIKTMKHIVKEVPEAVLLVAGEKEGQVQGMSKLARELGLENNIIFTGWIAGDQLKAAYHACCVVVVPVLYVTTFNRFNMEGMACKRPVVTTCFGAAAEIVKNNETGYTVDPFDTELMAQKIIDLLKNPQKAKQFGEAGYQRVIEKFNLDDKADEYLNWFEKHLSSPDT